MMKNVQDRYLLGEADENERAELEQEYFADDEAFDRLVEAENDLVDAYVQGTLTAGERKRFEERFLTTDAGVETVAFARALRERIAARAKPVPLGRWYPAPRRLAIAASLALFGFATAWVLFSLRQAQAPPPIQRQITRQSPAPPPAPSISETALLTVLLTPGGTRDDQAAPPLVLRPAPQWVQLELVLEENRYDS